MYTGTFSEIVGKDYDTIKNIFINRSNNRSLLWCEDTFHDVIIKCIERFEDKIVSNEEAIKYSWTAYVNTLLNYMEKSNLEIEFNEELDEEYNIEDTEYNNDIDNIYNIILADIKENFGNTGVTIINDYLNGKTIKDKVKVRKICKYLKTKYKDKIKFIFN